MQRLTCYRITATVDIGTANSDMSLPRGKIKAIEILYPTHNVNVNLTSKNLVTQTIVDLGATHTSAVLYPRTIAQTNGAVSLTFDGSHTVPAEFTIFGLLTLTLTSGTSGDSVTVIVYVEEQ